MEFKCKNCGKDKYRQINATVKQCLFCGKMILSAGCKAEDLDWTSEIREENLSDREITYKRLLKEM